MKWAYHKMIPRDPVAQCRWRRKLDQLLQKKPELRKAHRWMCERDILYWINSEVWQYNPNLILWEGVQRRRGPKVGPFATWPFQDEAIMAIVDGIEVTIEDVVIEKSREMGASWICIIVMLWYWLFRPMSSFILISKDADAVDANSHLSLLWKWDFILKNLPDWLRPQVKKTLMFRENLDNGATVTGQSSTGKAGVGGRCDALFVDEFTLIDDDVQVASHTSDTGSCRIFNFTHRGTGKHAAKLVERQDIKKVVMHWSQHPEKRGGLYRSRHDRPLPDILDKQYRFPQDYQFVTNGSPTGGPYPGLRSPWYDYQCRRKDMDSRTIAMDLDIDLKGATKQVFDPLVIATLKEACTNPQWQGDIEYDEDLCRVIKLVEKPNGPLKLWCTLDYQGKPPKARYAGGGDYGQGTGATPTCLSFANVKTGEMIAQYANSRIKPRDAARLTIALCWYFRDKDDQGAKFCWEMLGPGVTVTEQFMEMGYMNCYYRTDELRYSKKISDKPGWVPTPNTKDALLRSYADALDRRLFQNLCWESLEECLSFKWSPQGHAVHQNEDCDDESAARVNHGDRVIGAALCYKMIQMSGGIAEQPEEEGPPKMSILWRREFRKRRDRELEEA